MSSSGRRDLNDDEIVYSITWIQYETVSSVFIFPIIGWNLLTFFQNEWWLKFFPKWGYSINFYEYTDAVSYFISIEYKKSVIEP